MLEQQLSLPGLAPSPELDFLFFALLPSAEDALRIVRLRERLLLERGLTGRRIATERLHVSLHTVGAWHGLSRAAVSAARVTTTAATPVDLRPTRLRPGSLRVIFASFSARAPDRSRAIESFFRYCGRSRCLCKKA